MFFLFGNAVFGQNDTAFSKVFGSENDETICRIEKYQNGFIAVGTTQTTGKESDIFVELFDSLFNPINKVEIGTSYIEKADDFIIDDNGNIFICGITNAWGVGSYDAYLFKLNTSLILEWEYTFGSEGWDYPIGMAIGNGGQNFICVEKNEIDGKKIIDFISFYEDGFIDPIFSDTVTNTNSYNHFLLDNGYNFILSGSCISSNLEENALVVSYSSNGILNWENCLQENKDQSINHMILDNNHLYGVGYTYELDNGNKDYYMVELDLNGNLIKKSIPNYYPNDDEEAFFIMSTSNGFGIIAGTESIGQSPGKNDFQFIEVTSSGTLIDGYNYGWDETDTPTNFMKDSSGFLLFGNTNSIGNGYGDFVVIDINKTYSKPHLVYEKINSLSSQIISNVETDSPNNNNEEFDNLNIYDITGRLIFTGKKLPTNYKLPKNQVLILVFSNQNFTTTKKLVIEE